jgi:hypothetical protein
LSMLHRYVDGQKHPKDAACCIDAQQCPFHSLTDRSHLAGRHESRSGNELCGGVRDAVPGCCPAAAVRAPEQLGGVHAHDRGGHHDPRGRQGPPPAACPCAVSGLPLPLRTRPVMHVCSGNAPVGRLAITDSRPSFCPTTPAPSSSLCMACSLVDTLSAARWPPSSAICLQSAVSCCTCCCRPHTCDATPDVVLQPSTCERASMDTCAYW